MTINIPDQIIREFLSGVIAVLAVIAVGAFLLFILRGIAKKFPFIRMGLVLALAPLSLINFLDSSNSTALLVYAMVTTLLALAIDGIKHLLMPEEQSLPAQNPVKQEEETVESNPGAIVWGKAMNKFTLLVVTLLIIMGVLFVSTSWVLVENTHMIGERVKELVDTNEKQSGKTSGKVEERLDKDFEKTTSISTNVMKRLAVIDEMQERIVELSGKVESLQRVLADQRSREAFDEVQRSAPIPNTMPENSDSLQHTFDNGVRADDCIPSPPESTGTVCIDSKFPIESYLRMTDATLDDAARKTAEQQFLQEIKKPTKKFLVAVDNAHMIGKYRKIRSMEILENMETEVLHDEIEDLKKFIKNNCQTSP
ncbi:MAG: DNA recombination protein RmuC [Verrucomicrobiota bacterium]